MRLSCALLFALFIFRADNSFAQQVCSIAGTAYSDGASYCLPAVREGEVEAVLFTCEDGAWKSTDAVCPDQFAYSCRVGPHSVALGERLMLGSGPAFLECRFPGVLSLSDGSALPAASAPSLPSAMVRSVQRFLSSEEEGLDCTIDQCSGQVDGKTLSAISEYLRRNFANLTPEERAEWGFVGEAEVERVVRATNPIDLISLFVTTFDVPRTE